MNKYTGHKMYWADFDDWKAEQDTYTKEFWEDYKLYHKGTGDWIAQKVSKHAKIGAKWDRMALNAPTQGTGATCLKLAGRRMYEWVIANGYFNKCKLSALVHDEMVWEFPEELVDIFPKKLETVMLEAAGEYCKQVPIPAEASVGKYWIH